jgi:hypothetical protein
MIFSGSEAGLDDAGEELVPHMANTIRCVLQFLEVLENPAGLKRELVHDWEGKVLSEQLICHDESGLSLHCLVAFSLEWLDLPCQAVRRVACWRKQVTTPTMLHAYRCGILRLCFSNTALV